jgi:hypothetical protein
MHQPAMLHRRRGWDRVDDRRRGDTPAYVQGSLALTFPLASGLEAEPVCAALSVVGSSPERYVTVPDPEAWAARFLQAVVEVVSNERPLTQLARWTDQYVFSDIAQRRLSVAAAQRERSQASRTGRPQVATVHLCRPSVLVAEVSARVMAGSRSRALAARLEFHRERWLCTALDFG